MRDSCGICVRDVGDIGDVEYLVDVIDLAYIQTVRIYGVSNWLQCVSYNFLYNCLKIFVMNSKQRTYNRKYNLLGWW